MKSCRNFAAASVIALIASIGGFATAAETMVSFASLLREMIDRDVLARLPQPAYACRQASSYERLSVSPDDPDGWMANHDWSHFIRSEQIDGQTHWVMLDAEGPGCIVRIWSGGPKPKGKMRFYLDGSDQPSIEMPTDELLGGNSLVGPPLSAVRARGLNLYLPIPFNKSLKLDIEVWHWAQTNVGYAAATHWYARPGATWNRPPAPDQARVYGTNPPDPHRVEGALEGEALKIVEKTGGVTEIQDIAKYRWSGDKQLWWRDATPGNKLVLAMPVEKAGKYALKANLTKAVDYGIVRFSVDDKPLGEPMDLFNNGVITTGEIALGDVELAAGRHLLSLEITGANPQAEPRYMVELDYVRLEPAR